MNGKRAKRLRKTGIPHPGRRLGGLLTGAKTAPEVHLTIKKPPSSLRHANERNRNRARKNGVT